MCEVYAAESAHMRAIRTGRGISATYQAWTGRPHDVRLNPERTALNYDEWHPRARDGGLRPINDYKVARLATVALSNSLPWWLARRNARVVFDGFDGYRLERIVLIAHPPAVHKVAGRIFNLNQHSKPMSVCSLRKTFTTSPSKYSSPPCAASAMT